MNWIVVLLLLPGATSFIPHFKRSTIRNFPKTRATSTARHGHTFETDIYIEDTDTFGMVYHANYATLYERALSTVSPYAALVRCDKQKFVKSARLGDTVFIDSEHLGFGKRDNGEEVLVWEQTCRLNQPDGEEINTAIAYYRHAAIHGGDAMPWPERTKRSYDVINTTPNFRVYRDECEFDRDTSTDIVGMKAVLRYFERSRTLGLGGPKKLDQCVTEGIAIVVAKIDGLEVLDTSTGPGSLVFVESEVKLRGKSIVMFHHSLFRVDESSNILIAEGDVTCACVTAEGKAGAFPGWTLDAVRKTAAQTS